MFCPLAVPPRPPPILLEGVLTGGGSNNMFPLDVSRFCFCPLAGTPKPLPSLREVLFIIFHLLYNMFPLDARRAFCFLSVGRVCCGGEVGNDVRRFLLHPRRVLRDVVLQAFGEKRSAHAFQGRGNPDVVCASRAIPLFCVSFVATLKFLRRAELYSILTCVR